MYVCNLYDLPCCLCVKKLICETFSGESIFANHELQEPALFAKQQRITGMLYLTVSWHVYTVLATVPVAL